MILLFDIGGTKMRFAVTKDGKEFSEPVILKTPETYEESIALIGAQASELAGGEKIERAFGGCTGTFNRERSEILMSPNLSDWVGKSVRADIEKTIGAPVHIDNDTAVVGLGESQYGAGKGYEIVAYMTVSTGVGGSRIVNDEMDEKGRSFEPGHQIVDYKEGTTLENLVSGTAVKKRFGKEGHEIEDRETWSILAKELAVGIHNTLLHWSPDVLVIGGSMVTGKGPCFDMEEVINEVKTLSPLMEECVIKKADLADLNGLYGALAWAQQKNS